MALMVKVPARPLPGVVHVSASPPDPVASPTDAVPPKISWPTPRTYSPGPRTLWTVMVIERDRPPSVWVPTRRSAPGTPNPTWAEMEMGAAVQALPSIFAVKPSPPPDPASDPLLHPEKTQARVEKTMAEKRAGRKKRRDGLVRMGGGSWDGGWTFPKA